MCGADLRGDLKIDVMKGTENGGEDLCNPVPQSSN